MWTNGKMNERSNGDGIGVLSMDWVEDGEVICQFSGDINGNTELDMGDYKSRAEAHMTSCMQLETKEEKIASDMITFMNEAG